MASALQRISTASHHLGQTFTALLGRNITVPTQTPSGTSLKPHEIQRHLAYYWQQFLKDQPIAFLEICYRCRYYAVNSSFMQMFLPMRTSIYNDGLQIIASSGTQEDQDKLNEWKRTEAPTIVDSIMDQATQENVLMESNVTNWERFYKFSTESWNEWATVDNVVGFWLTDRGFALTIPPERCLYSDVMGLETMKYIHGLHHNQILQLPEQQQERFRNNPAVFINPRFGEHFKLIKRSATGDGFAMPGMLSVFKTLGEEESKEMGFHQLAWTMRKVTRQHKIGHEIKQGTQAGRAHYFYDEERDMGIQKAWRDVIGIDDYVCNFDHEIIWPWPDLKQFDEIAFKGSDARLRRWAGPIGLMLVAKGVAPYLPQLARSQGRAERATMGPFLNMMLKKAFNPPVPCEVAWSETVFTEDRLRAELIKFGALQGWVSPQTGTTEIGLNTEVEQRNKVEAADDKDAQKKWMPIFDPAHNASPALDGPLDPNAKAKAAGGTGAAPGAKAGTPAGQPHKS